MDIRQESGANEPGSSGAGATAASRGGEWVTLAVLSKPRGIRGELFALPESTHWERFQPGRSFMLWFAEASGKGPRKLELEDAWDHNGKLILKFAGVDSIEDADELRGADVCLREDEREPLPEGEYYYSDLRGCRVLDIDSGEELAVVSGFTEGIGPGVLDVETISTAKEGGPDVDRWQIPFAAEICLDVDLSARVIRVRLPEGLRDLNRQ